MEEKNIGYKVMNANMTCRGFKYEIGKTYEIEGNLEICKNGFHFCKNIFSTLNYYYNNQGDNRYFKILYDKCIDDDDKSVTNKITILEEVNILDFINDSMTKKDWFNISCYQKLSEDFIRKYKYSVNWNLISSRQKLSENFIREFQDNVNWLAISSNQNLSENFIREFQYKVDWNLISKYQKLSEDFCREFKYMLYIKN